MKNIIPAIASTNAIIAAACALEALKLLTVCSSGIENYMMCASSSTSLQQCSRVLCRLFQLEVSFCSNAHDHTILQHEH